MVSIRELRGLGSYFQQLADLRLHLQVSDLPVSLPGAGKQEVSFPSPGKKALLVLLAGNSSP